MREFTKMVPGDSRNKARCDIGHGFASRRQQKIIEPLVA